MCDLLYQMTHPSSGRVANRVLSVFAIVKRGTMVKGDPMVREYTILVRLNDVP